MYLFAGVGCAVLAGLGIEAGGPMWAIVVLVYDALYCVMMAAKR